MATQSVKSIWGAFYYHCIFFSKNGTLSRTETRGCQNKILFFINILCWASGKEVKCLFQLKYMFQTGFGQMTSRGAFQNKIPSVSSVLDVSTVYLYVWNKVKLCLVSLQTTLCTSGWAAPADGLWCNCAFAVDVPCNPLLTEELVTEHVSLEWVLL